MTNTSPVITMNKKFKEALAAWKANDEWKYADNEAAWKFFFEAGQTAVLPPNTVAISKDDLNCIHEFLFVINPDKDGGFFICEEATEHLEEVNEIINKLI